MEVIENRDVNAPEGPTCCSENEGPPVCDVCDQHILNEQQGVFVCRKCAPLDIGPCLNNVRVTERLGRASMMIVGWIAVRFLAALILHWALHRVWSEAPVGYGHVVLATFALSAITQKPPNFIPSVEEERIYKLRETRARLGLVPIPKAFVHKLRDLFIEGVLGPYVFALLLLGLLGAFVR